MKIAILSPVWFPVPPTGYGGIEAVVSLLADGLVAAGEDVTLFASGDSTSAARVESVFERAPSEWIGHTFWELRHALRCIEQHDSFDLIHDHSGLLGAALAGRLPTPSVHTVHGPLTGAPGEVYESICAVGSAPGLISISRSQRRPKPGLPWIANIPNAIDLDRYPFDPRPGEALVFLGRMSPDKGPERALDVAERTGLPLLLAGKCSEPGERAYFDRYVKPRLGNGREYIGVVGHDEKLALLRDARAVLFPIDWEEPFGLVMIEAMACGTPVIATRRGSVPEVIVDGVTGVIVDGWDDPVPALLAAESLDPVAMRRDVEARFAPERLVADHLEAYELAIEQAEDDLVPQAIAG